MADVMESESESWFDVADEMLDESVEREASVTLEAEDLTVDVPLAFGETADRARWGFDGQVTVTVDGMRGSFAEWVHLFDEREE
jgi:hypothetical protein